MNFKTEQEAFWAGDFGNKYIERNQGNHVLASKTAFFSKVLAKTSGIKNVLEFGCNIGLNLQAVHRLLPHVELTGIEINKKAAQQALESLELSEIINTSILDFTADTRQWDLTFTSGVLIHINPDELGQVYDKLYQHTRKYILVSEYYNPTPVEVTYRGHSQRLFKRDFAGELLEKYTDLHIVDYGFIWHKDPNFPADDATWFLLEKR